MGGLAYVAPGPPTWRSLLFDWEPDLLFLAVVGAIGLYALGVRRLAARGRRWPTSRSLAFAAGMAVIVVATQSGFAAYDRTLFSFHVVQHLMLAAIAPILLALGAPITLALQAGRRRTQERLLAVLHHRIVRTLTHPVAAWLLYGGFLFVLYFTSLYELSLRNEWVHLAVHVHFVVAGSLFFWYVVGLDPIRPALTYGARLLFVIVVLPFHAFLGVAILGSRSVIAADWYDGVVRNWGSGPLADQRTGAGILWAFGELLGLIAIAVVLTQWMRHEERVAARSDRALDAAARPDEPVATVGRENLPRFS